MTDARSEVLAAVRAALGRETTRDRAADYDAVPRAYRATPLQTREEIVNLFEERLRDYDCVTQRCASTGVCGAVARSLTASGRTRMLIAPDFPAEWLPDGFVFIRDGGMSHREIDVETRHGAGVLTLCAAAIALTGTIILHESVLHESGRGQGRRVLSLLPDYHLCIVEAGQIVETVPEGLRMVENAARTPITTISGPSATADIEMTRIRGVHGPRMLEVIIAIGN